VEIALDQAQLFRTTAQRDVFDTRAKVRAQALVAPGTARKRGYGAVEDLS
jgi:hypothetical protein